MDYGENVDFLQHNRDTDKGELYNGKMVPGGGLLRVDGEPSVGIPGIKTINVGVHDGTTYSYIITVHGACPKGKGHSKLVFTDAKGDTYSKKIYSTTDHDHTVRYSSADPTIVKVTWAI